jgi:stage II sporulation protein D
MEALKAQAVASRTYAMYQMQENKDNDYDVTSDIYSQVYGGKASERFRTSQAVDETDSQILTFEGKVFPAFFSATCAGHTEDASLLWDTDLTPLKGVVCGFCRESPHYNWHYVFSLPEIEDKLAQSGRSIKGISQISILGRDNSGRITDLKITSAQEETKIAAKDFRNIIGPNIIRSTNFNVTVVDSDAVFEGLGWGHGAGLCQWGAYFMAKQGYKYEEILKFYYPQAEISSISGQ